MSNAKQHFTPGPWALWGDSPDVSLTTAVVAPHGGFVAYSKRIGDSRTDMLEAHANARLIAAAPEMYAALRELLAEFDAYEWGGVRSILNRIDGDK